MLTLQFLKVSYGKQFLDQFYIFPCETHSVVSEKEMIVFKESGILGPELYCKDSGFMQLELSIKNLQSVTGNKMKHIFPRMLFKVHKQLCTVCENEKPRVKFRRTIYLDGYCISAFFSLLKLSNAYRSHVLNFHYGALWKKLIKYDCLIEIYIYQEQPRKHFLDYAGSKRFEFLVHQRIELEHAMSWLSTLGGAFSALGETQIHCAVVAGRISVQQFQIALKLGDEITVMRCILYYGLSLVQTGYLKQARKVIEHQYNMAKAMPCIDSRILSMCHGIWARLKYEYEKRRHQKAHSKVMKN